MAQIHACCAGSFSVLIEEIIDEDSYPPECMSKPNRGVADNDAHFDNDFDNSFDNEIEDSYHIFIAHVHSEDSKHFVRAASTVSQHLAEAFTKNSKATSFRDAVPSSLHEFKDIFSEGTCDNLVRATLDS
jgi:hypothetical protein